MTEQEAREAVIQTARSMSATGLSYGTSGNVSARVDGGMVITPTGVPYMDLNPAKISFVGNDGSLRDGELKPSSEWHFHLAIYNARQDVGAIVHTHSEFATALSCTGQGIPAFHYMVAVAGGRDIRCSPYATFGTDELASHAVNALEGRKACLLGNHGVIACGAHPAGALNLAWEVEHLARQYTHALAIGHVNYLSDKQMDVVIEKFKSYGQQR